MILLVNPDSSEAERLQTLLKGQSPLMAAKSREEALELAHRHPVKLAILDLGDSVAEVYDTLHGLWDLREDTPILLVSEPEYKGLFMPIVQAGLAQYLEKPFGLSDIKSKIQKIQGISVEEPVRENPPPAPPQEPLVEMDPVTMDRLIMDLAHRLKNPLVSIRTFAHLFKERFNDARFQNDFYQTMRREVERMDSLIDQLIEFSELPDPSCMPHPVLPAVEEAIRASQERLKNTRITLKSHLQEKPQTVWMDREQMVYALIHLFSGLGRCMEKSAQPEIVAHLQADTTGSEGIEILLQCSGSPFKDRSQFSGLELFIAKRIIERQQGVVQWEFISEGPASVRILLPAYTPTSHLPREAAQASWRQLSPAYVERRKQQLAIVFKERRIKQRRLYTRSSYFPDRRKKVPATT